MRPVVALAVLVLVALAAGCGNGDGGDIEQAAPPSATISPGSRKATAIGHAAGCRTRRRRSSQIRSQNRSRRAGSSRARRRSSASANISMMRNSRGRESQVNITLNRDKATASVEDGPSDLTVIKVDGEWLIDPD